MSKRIACAHIPNFPISLVLRRNQSIGGKPLVLSDPSSGKGLIVSLNERAEKAGVCRNMTVARGRSLCKNLLIEPRDFESEKTASAEIIETLQSIGPSVKEGERGTYFLDTSGLTLLYRSEKVLAEKIISAVRAKLLPVKVGIGENLFIARVAAEVSEVSGFTIVTAGTEDKFLREIPIDHLWISDENMRKLSDLGIKTIGEISSFDENELALRFKAEGTKLSLHSKGDDPCLFSPESLPRKFSRRIFLTYSIYESERIILHIEKLMNELINKIRHTGHAVARILICLRLEDRSERSFNVKLDKPTVNVRKFKRQIRQELGKLQLESGVNEIKVKITSAMPEVSEQLELEKTKSNTNVLKSGNVINIPDFGRLCLPELRSSFLPERNFTFSPTPYLGETKRSIDRRGEWYNPYAISTISGLRLFNPPKEAFVMTEGAVPRSIVLEGISRSIEKYLGPWQISGEWWDKGFERFYFEIETKDNKLYLLYYDKLSSRWFMHGIFD